VQFQHQEMNNGYKAFERIK